MNMSPNVTHYVKVYFSWSITCSKEKMRAPKHQSSENWEHSVIQMLGVMWISLQMID